jgi:hypothetical protein
MFVLDKNRHRHRAVCGDLYTGISLGIVFYNHLFLFLVFAVYNMLSGILLTVISENCFFSFKN